MSLNRAGVVGLSIAGFNLAAVSEDQTVLDRLAERYSPFLAYKQPELSVRLLPGRAWHGERLDQVVEAALRQGTTRFSTGSYAGTIDLAEHRASFAFPDTKAIEDIDYFLRVVLALLVFEGGGVMFHSAGIVRDGLAYLFFGHSGSGKTTVARLSPGDLVLNDDLLVLMPPAGADNGRRWIVHGTPFTNPTQMRPAAICAPLGGLFRLVQARQVYAVPMGHGQALAEMIANVPVIPLDALKSLALLERLSGLLAVMPAYNLHFLPDPSFWPVVEKVGSGNEPGTLQGSE